MPPSECVRVAVRCRPLSEREAAAGQAAVVSVDAARGQVALEQPGVQARGWTFDLAFGPGATQAEVYAAACSDLVDSALAGYNATLFAYGQTGTGKTHTMEGSGGGAGAGGDLPPGAGLIPRAFRHIFQAIGASADQTFLVRASMLEIYNEEIRDLLSKNPKNRLELREARDGGVYVQGLNTFVVKSEAEIAAVLEVGRRNRTVGATLMNQDSSRSHSVFTVTIEAAAAGGGGAGGGGAEGSGGAAGGSGIRVGKLNLVDLAGSERQAKTGAAGERLKEASKINLSLSALGNVISALVDGKSGHVPYRDSKLTRLLQDSLGGNTRTVMVANVGPGGANAEESLATLRYASRAKHIRNQPRVNEDPKDAMLREFQEEIARLRAELAAAGGGAGGGDGSGAAAQAGAASSGSAMSAPAAAEAELGPAEVVALQQQLEAELRGEWSSSGAALDDAAVAQIKRDVEVQLAGQLEAARAERRRAAEEAARLGAQVQQRSAQVLQVAARKEAEAARNAELAAKLRMLEGRLLHGEQRGGLDRLARQAAAQVSRQEAELRRQRAAEAEASQRIASLEGRAQAVQSHTRTLQEEAEAVSAQLAAAEAALAGARAELSDVYARWERDREELVETVRALHYNLALKALVIDAFVPQEEVAKLMRRMSFNAEDNSWSLCSTASGGVAGSPAALPRRPASASAGPRVGSAARRAGAALLQLELDVPERRVLDLSHVQFVLDAVTAA